MLDWLAIWGVTQAVGFVFKPILEDLAKDAAKDWAKDLLKGIPNKLLQRLKKEDIEVAAGKALKEFLQIVQQELEDADLESTQLKEYTKPLKQFIQNKAVKEILASPFQPDCQTLDYKILANTWNQLNFPTLPDEFNWERIAKRYLKKVKALINESDKLRSLQDSENIEQIKDILQQNAGIIPDFDLIKYQEAIRECYVNLNLNTVDTSGYAYNELKLWRMFIPQNVREVHQVVPHEFPKEHLRQLRESNQLEAEISEAQLEDYKKVYLESPMRSVLDVVKENPPKAGIVILGDPGSGKSTLLQYLALNWVEETLDKKTFDLPIPLLIELRTYMRRRLLKECGNFLEFFHKCSGAIIHLNQNKLHEHLKAGNALVMFDGLDEVFDAGMREDVITDIHRFTNEYPNVQVIVTSRVIGYKAQRLRDGGFRHFILQDLEPEQIQEFINRWHDLTFNDVVDKERKQQRLQKGIDESKAIGELAGNPLLLTMMAILNRNQELPRDRAELYKKASELLLYKWDVERALEDDKHLPTTIDYKDKQAMLRQVAYKMQTSEKGLAGNLIKGNDLEKIFTDYLKSVDFSDVRDKARRLIEQLRTRNFMLCFLGADYYGFVHRTFLEYFSAWEFVWQFKESQTLSIKELKQEVFGKHWRDETWHEVLRLIAGMIEPKFVGEIIEYLMAENGKREEFINLFLAAECFVEVRNRSVIASTGDKLVERIKERATDDDTNVRRDAVQTLASNFKEYPDTLPFLKERATKDERKYVRCEAVNALARNFKEDKDTLPFLKERAIKDAHELVRCEAVVALARNFKEHPDTLPFLFDRTTEGNHWYVRCAAVRALARNFKEDKDTLPLLFDRATNDDNRYVRDAAVQALASNFKEHKDTLPLLFDRATKDDDMYVRDEAVQALASNFKDEPGMFEFFYNCAVNDPFERKYDWQDNPRLTALEAIIQHYPDHQLTLPLLRDRAENDADEKVREFASEELGVRS